jgi:methionyl-tRNA formyltransferase
MHKFIFWGGKEIGNYVLENLLGDNLIPLGIIAYQNIIDENILFLAEKKGSKILRVKAFKKEQQEIEDFISEINPKAFISVAFPFVLSVNILKLVRYPINIHTGAIPKYRGHHPISAAMLNDEPFQGTTVHFMAPEVDAGDILLQDFVEVTNEDNINTIKSKLIVKSYLLLKSVIKQLENDCLHPKKQIGEIIWAPKRTEQDSKINFNNKSRYLHNFIRALVDPYPNAFVENGSRRIKIKNSIASNTPGIVLDKTVSNKYVVSTKDGVLLLDIDTELEIGQKII